MPGCSSCDSAKKSVISDQKPSGFSKRKRAVLSDSDSGGSTKEEKKKAKSGDSDGDESVKGTFAHQRHPDPVVLGLNTHIKSKWISLHFRHMVLYKII